MPCLKMVRPVCFLALSVLLQLIKLALSGVVVVPGVLSQEGAASYVSKAQDWLESFGLGYDRKDPATYRQSNLPPNEKGGLYTTHGACHQQFLWDLRQEEKVIDAFEKIWGTRELLVSFGMSRPGGFLVFFPRLKRSSHPCSDGVNIGVPLDLTQNENKGLDTPWPHVDQVCASLPRHLPLLPPCLLFVFLTDNLIQSPTVPSTFAPSMHPGYRQPGRKRTSRWVRACAKSDPPQQLSDHSYRGLMVFHGSRELFEECFYKFSHQSPSEGWSDEDWYRHTPEMLEWMKEKGCHWEKICAHPGDLILWDSVRLPLLLFRR